MVYKSPSPVLLLTACWDSGCTLPLTAAASLISRSWRGGNTFLVALKSRASVRCCSSAEQPRRSCDESLTRCRPRRRPPQRPTGLEPVGVRMIGAALRGVPSSGRRSLVCARAEGKSAAAGRARSAWRPQMEKMLLLRVLVTEAVVLVACELEPEPGGDHPGGCRAR